jgi:drug/metabolite transporter (DMT)-like permease
MTWGILLGLGSALGWGTASFFAGIQARRLPAMMVTLWSQAGGALVLLTALLLAGITPVWGGVAWGLLAGLFGSTALLLFYQGMALGAVSIIAPVSACGALVPVLLGLARGELPSVLGGMGIVLAIAGIVLVSIQPEALPNEARRQRQALLLALGAAFGFGMFFVIAAQGGEVPGASPLWNAAGSRIGGLMLLATAQLLRAGSLPLPGRHLGALVAIGVVDTLATILFMFAAQLGNLGVVSVLSSLYPVVTVWLSQMLLAERLTRLQYGGVALALSGVALLAAG